MSKNEHLIMTKADQERLIQFVTSSESELRDAETQRGDIHKKLQAAKVTFDTDFPRNVSRLYSTITVRDTIARINHTYKLLPPNEADREVNGISVLSPLGFILMGRRVGSSFSWQFKNKKKYFLMVDIVNSYS
jgi:transcription elongation GreA/GreB family factor